MIINPVNLPKKIEAIKERIEKRAREKNLTFERKRLAIELETLRVELGYSQEKLSKKAGINQDTYKKLIGAIASFEKPRDVTLKKLSVFFKKDPLHFHRILYHNETFQRDPSPWITEYMENDFDITEMNEYGYLVDVEKKIVNVALQDNLAQYVHAVGTDENLDKNSIMVLPGRLESIDRPRQYWYIRQSFSPPYNKGEKAILTLRYRTFARKMIGELDKECYYSYKCTLPTEVIIIKITFPIERPCQYYEVKKFLHTMGDVSCCPSDPIKKCEDGRTRIVWKLEKPDFLGEYTIYWKW